MEITLGGVKQKILKKRKPGRPKKNTVVVKDGVVIFPKGTFPEYKVTAGSNSLSHPQ